MAVSINKGSLHRCPHNKRPTIWGSILGHLVLGPVDIRAPNAGAHTELGVVSGDHTGVGAAEHLAA